MTERKVLVIGLDAAAPDLVFNRFRDRLPNISRMMSEGVYCPLRSCDPPITVPAWLAMATSRSPGRLGLYGFRHRKGYSYTDMWVPNSGTVREPTLWDIVGSAGGEVCLVAIPPSYPPPSVHGHLVSCFLTPDDSKSYTHPKSLRDEVEDLVGQYVFDVPFRTDDRDKLLESIYDMTQKRFRLMQHLLHSKTWHLAMMVEIGLDRVQHAFWKFFDPQHSKYLPGNRFEKVVEDYYSFLDEQVGRLIQVG